jgi:hypothetical protein
MKNWSTVVLIELNIHEVCFHSLGSAAAPKFVRVFLSTVAPETEDMRQWPALVTLKGHD